MISKLDLRNKSATTILKDIEDTKNISEYVTRLRVDISDISFINRGDFHILGSKGAFLVDASIQVIYR